MCTNLGNILEGLLLIQSPKKERKKLELLLGKKNMNKNIYVIQIHAYSIQNGNT